MTHNIKTHTKSPLARIKIGSHPPGDVYKLSGRTRCPFCLSAIPLNAQVCKFCSRDVYRLIQAESKVQDIQTQGHTNDSGLTLPEVSEESPSNIINARRALKMRIILWTFYLLSILPQLVFWYIPKPADYFQIYPFIVVGLAFVAGLSLVVLNAGGNIWTLFIVGFSEPWFATLALILIGKAEFNTLSGLAGEFLLQACQIGAASVIGAALAPILGKRPERGFYNIAGLVEWLTTSQTLFERLEKFALAIGSLIAALTVLASHF
jgi:hypothetical protein